MFASSAPTARRSSASAGAYRQVSIETGVTGASAHQLVTMLFDGFNDAIGQARAAMAAGEIETKGRSITRAVRIVDEGLKASLDSAGGELSANLGALYAYVALRLTEANLRNDVAALDECLHLIEPVRAAWLAIAPAAAASADVQ